MKQPLGPRVAHLRKSLGLTQQQLASRMGVSQTFICHIEAGRRLQGGVDTLVQLASALDVSPAELLTPSPIMEAAPTAA